MCIRDRINVNDRICQFRIQKHQPVIRFEETDTLGNENRGGIAYVLDEDNDLYTRMTKEMVFSEEISNKYDVMELKLSLIHICRGCYNFLTDRVDRRVCYLCKQLFEIVE